MNIVLEVMKYSQLASTKHVSSPIGPARPPPLRKVSAGGRLAAILCHIFGEEKIKLFYNIREQFHTFLDTVQVSSFLWFIQDAAKSISFLIFGVRQFSCFPRLKSYTETVSRDNI